jgi:hypothetical protein
MLWRDSAVHRGDVIAYRRTAGARARYAQPLTWGDPKTRGKT